MKGGDKRGARSKPAKENAGRDFRDAAEWNFAGCPTREREECFQWEMARESPAIRADVCQLRAAVGSQTFEELFAKLRPTIFSEPRNPRPRAVFWFCPEFPLKPYLSSADERTRADRLRHFCGDKQAEQAARAQILDGRNAIIPEDIGRRIHASSASRRPVYRIGPFELALLQIEWEEHDKIITEHFKAWLIKNRPGDVEVRPYNGAGTPYRQRAADLKRLGAWRLLKLLSPTDAADFSQREGGRPLYADEADWLKAKRRIAKELAGFERLFSEFSQKGSNKKF